MFKEWIKRAFGRQYRPLNKVEVSATTLINNYKVLSGIDRNIRIAPVLKSNAYGHGLIEAARILDLQKVPFFCVDSIYEAYKLYLAGIKTPILIMGYVDTVNLGFKKLPFSFAVYDINQLIKLTKKQPNVGLHIFVDTGMGREGVPVRELGQFLDKIPKRYLKNIEGVMSHFAAADKVNDQRTKNQVVAFKNALKIFGDKNISLKWTHMANSSGLLNNRKLGIDKITNMVRCGIALFGIDPEGKNRSLKMAAKLTTEIAQIKLIEKGATVGYDYTYSAKRNIKVAVLPIGYNDGVDRELSNKGEAIVKGKTCRIIGRVSMNITTIDVSGVKGVRVGDKTEIKFTIPSKNKIPYEFLVNLNPEIKRVVVS